MGSTRESSGSRSTSGLSASTIAIRQGWTSGSAAAGPSPPYPPSTSSSATIVFPQFVVGGVSFRPTENWNLEFDLDWTDWGAVKQIVFQGTPFGNQVLPLNYRSSFMYEFGATDSSARVTTEASVSSSARTPARTRISPRLFPTRICIWAALVWGTKAGTGIGAPPISLVMTPRERFRTTCPHRWPTEPTTSSTRP